MWMLDLYIYIIFDQCYLILKTSAMSSIVFGRTWHFLEHYSSSSGWRTHFQRGKSRRRLLKPRRFRCVSQVLSLLFCSIILILQMTLNNLFYTIVSFSILGYFYLMIIPISGARYIVIWTSKINGMRLVVLFLVFWHFFTVEFEGFGGSDFKLFWVRKLPIYPYLEQSNQCFP